MAILRFFCILVYSCLILFTGAAYAQEAAHQEYKVKAVFLYNFLNFIDRPAAAPSEKQHEATVCILGEDPFGEHIDAIKGNKVGGKTINVKRLKNIEEIKSCSAVFISDSEEDNLEKILQYSRKNSVLTVSDMDGFVKNGGIIQFLTKDKKIRFRINIGAAESAGLKISSKLIRVSYTGGEK